MTNFLGKFHALVAFVAANDAKTYSLPLVREVSLLALCRYQITVAPFLDVHFILDRFMIVSSSLCQTYLPVVMTALENESSALVRATVMIGLGDMAFRFPNLIEPWTKFLYSR